MAHTEAACERATADARANFRKAVAQFATGIAIVTVEAEQSDEVHGMTINSFTSFSLDPPTVLVR
ncbi:flavin reductase (DIM6/NTAB) family NADH-FMN oxidoreductase RutF [Paraburkholderia sp. UCT70]|uniref:flavin reductase n=1 Tax=Paraburkholderia sp. UCT70 TaxID=2991068 RepID=UPI003D1B36FC